MKGGCTETLHKTPFTTPAMPGCALMPPATTMAAPAAVVVAEGIEKGPPSKPRTSEDLQSSIRRIVRRSSSGVTLIE